MIVKIVNWYHDKNVLVRGGVYIGRYNSRIGPPGSPLGNPFILNVDGDRLTVIARYRDWLRARMKAKDPAVCGEIAALAQRLEKRKELTLVCYCAPAACHGDVIAEVLSELFGADKRAPKVVTLSLDHRERNRC